MRVGGPVLCIDETVLVTFKKRGVTAIPLKGKVYTVESLSDSCGCGNRILLEEFQNTSFPLKAWEGGVNCTNCHKPVDPSRVGWPKKCFIDLTGDEVLTDETSGVGKEMIDVDTLLLNMAKEHLPVDNIAFRVVILPSVKGNSK